MAYQDVLARLENLYRKLDEEGWHVNANTVALAIEEINRLRQPDQRKDLSGLDDGPYLPGHTPRKCAEPKSAEEIAVVRSKAWVTRRQKYGSAGHR